MAVMLTMYLFFPNVIQRAALVAQETDPPSQKADNLLGDLLNEETAPKTIR